MSTSAPGRHDYPKTRASAPPRRILNRKPVTFSAAALAQQAHNAKVLDARVTELRDALVAQAQRGQSPNVRAYIDAKDWKNEGGICRRFVERYGCPPKTYALAFAACSVCACVALNATCTRCGERARIQGGIR